MSQSFDGEFNPGAFLSDKHEIKYKVDNVPVIENFVNLPAIGDTPKCCKW